MGAKARDVALARAQAKAAAAAAGKKKVRRGGARARWCYAAPAAVMAEALAVAFVRCE